MIFFTKNALSALPCPRSPFLICFVLFFIPRSPFLILVTSTAGMADNAFAWGSYDSHKGNQSLRSNLS